MEDKIQEVQDVFENLTQENQDIMLLLAKGMEISQNNTEKSL